MFWEYWCYPEGRLQCLPYHQEVSIPLSSLSQIAGQAAVLEQALQR